MTAAIESSRVCPPDDALALYVDGGLATAARAELERHVDACSLCRRIALERRSASLDTSADRLRDLFVEAQPQRLGRYEVRDRIGAGAMGTVYAAHDPELDRTVAIKCVAIRDAATLARHRERLREEAQALARIADPRVVRIYDVGDQDGLLFLVMERVDGSTLRAWVEGRSRAEILAAFAEAGRVLGGLHRRGLVHGDFKPDNVIVEPGGRVRVLDFGLARSLAEVVDTDTPRSGRGRGTPVYMAPELLAGDVSTPATDQWAWAVSLFEALCGRRPFSGRDLEALQRSTARASLRWPSASVPRRVRRVVNRALEPPADRRWPSMHDCVRALRPRPRRRIAATIGLAGIVGALAPTSPAQHPTSLEPATSWPAPWAEVDRAREPPTAPLGLESAVYDLRRRIDAAQRRVDANAVERALVELEAVVSEAERLGFSPLLAEALATRGLVLRRHDEVDRAIADLERAYTLAAGQAYDVIAAYCADQLVVIAGVDKQRPDQAARWARHADAAIARSDLRLSRANLANSRGLVALYNNDLDAARAHHERAIVLMRRADADPSHVAAAQHNLGNTLLRLRRPELAVPMIRAAIDVELRGGDVLEPDDATMLIGLAMALEATGEIEDAERTLRRAIEVLESAGARKVMLAHALYNLGAMLLDRNAYATALNTVERAVAVYAATLGDDHADTALAKTLVGSALSGLGQFDEADAILATARVSLSATLGPESPKVIQLMRMIARNEVASGRPDRGAQTLRCALAEAEAAEASGFERGLLLNTLGNLERERGNLDEAEAILRRAIALEVDHPSHQYRSTRQENLALVLRDAGRFDEALDVLDEAIALAETLRDAARPRLAALLGVRGSIGLHADQPQLAAASFEQAAAMLESDDPLGRIEYLRLLAEAESHLGDREASRTTLERSRELAAHTPGGRESLDAAEAWLHR